MKAIRDLLRFLLLILAISLFCFVCISFIDGTIDNEIDKQLAIHEILNDPEYYDISRIREYNEIYSKYAFWDNTIFDIFISDKYIKKGYITK